MSENNLERYFETLEQRAKLQDLMARSSEDLQTTIQDAIALADQTITSFESDENIGMAIASFGESTEKDLAVIDELQTSVDIGLIPAETLQEKRDLIIGDHRKSRALSYLSDLRMLQSAGIEEVAVAVEPTEAQEQSVVTEQVESLEKEKEYPKIDITIRGDGVMIGKKGRFVKLSKAHRANQRDYSKERKEILKVLVENAGGDPLTPRELWESAFGNEEFDQDAMTQVRLWLQNSITYNRKPIVIRNRSRRYSAYSIENPNVSIKEIAVTTPKSQVKVAPKKTELDSIIKLETSETQARTEIAEQVEEKEILPSVEFPLSHAESLIIAEFLNVRSKVLEECGIPAFEDETVKGLYLKDMTYKVSQELNYKYGGDLITAREEIIKKVNEYFEDGEVVLADIENMSSKDFRIELFQYLFDLDSEQREMLLSVVAAANPDIVLTLDGGSFTSGIQVIKAETGYVRKDGSPLVEEEKDNTVTSAETAIDSDSVEEEITVEEVVTDTTVEETLGSVALDSVVDTHEDSQERIPEPWEEKFSDDVTKALESLFDDGLLTEDTETITLDLFNNKSKSRKNGTRTGIKRAVTLGIISYGQTEFSVKETVSMIIQNSHKSIFSAPKRSTKHDRAEAIIDQAILTFKNNLRQDS